ncbi:hypothetical protein PG637_07085 [Riemerella anatipestifer]|nr:hypothetical protein [Riemerella anatipestifer]MDY3325431.1 hypothetical protein [Riemerella anatipestifer]MDY3354166.1 hypothetical protein [Riemerella anatipestifer]
MLIKLLKTTSLFDLKVYGNRTPTIKSTIVIGEDRNVIEENRNATRKNTIAKGENRNVTEENRNATRKNTIAKGKNRNVTREDTKYKGHYPIKCIR